MKLFRRRLSTAAAAAASASAFSSFAAPSTFATLPRHVHDRGLDHAVEREKHRRTVIGLKNLIKSEPTKSLPLSAISRQRDALQIPTRPVEFLRRFPSVLAEFARVISPLTPSSSLRMRF
ncbi:hypothetical protein MLD38_001609 [Melastoma candidum]|uniref:Uncharacterized protein n=1 Tax=Melastoma candidum TaxID=119954 RepID=A0ACB9SME5_9MYRT|nr:hypothetical protein MLD38_001609 [Melastoma candidum]